jgi:hypothetical protein
VLLKVIVDPKSDGSAVKADDDYIVSTNGDKTRRLTTKGWKLLVAWKDGSVSWEPLKDMMFGVELFQFLDDDEETTIGYTYLIVRAPVAH